MFCFFNLLDTGESMMFIKQETYQRALLQWTRAAAQGKLLILPFFSSSHAPFIHSYFYSFLLPSSFISSPLTKLYLIWDQQKGTDG